MSYNQTIVLPPIQRHSTTSDFKPPPIHKLQTLIWGMPSAPEVKLPAPVLPPLVSVSSSSSPDPLSPTSLQTLLPPPTVSVGSTPSSPDSPLSPSAHTEVRKQRKKRQCPQCHLLFSNLATHKSTHLSITARPHVCHTCDRGFARPNDLQRHEKRHLKDLGQIGFKCPFYDEEPGSKCHPSGCFSRCDTFKNHLKALHFQYPSGTRKRQRNAVAGRCKACGQIFESVDVWLNGHVENRECSGSVHGSLTPPNSS
ncbi:unnamed protein product [Kuraishia capsulata CBS 1993]|uniref:C2H2-type domain-containing protein n=1 Tax=Kuraishia capsulata CBS 1993 TaxID=1382522 RepID=W6MT95_9ASCO|nr:uncharacterized protein KUCA_T00000942001 [Kuraishia capsulata CBS 1993]CDK24975.1 unnamed protein product [Kuraishia capsulata CBS 1993]